MKRIISLIIIFSFLAVNTVVFAVANTNEVMNSYEKEAVTLIDLGIITDYEINEYDPFAFIPNKEFLDMLRNLTNREDVVDYQGYAEQLTGTSDMYAFQPYLYPTADFATQCVLGALGYNKLNALEGYRAQNGYIAQANNLGLLKGVKYSNEQSLRRCEAVKIIYNMLEAPVFEMDSATGDSITYAQSDVTALYYFKKTSRVTGIVSAAGYTAMYGESSLPEDQIMIGNTTYRCNKDFSDYVGVYCDVYVQTEDDAVMSVSPGKGCEKATLNAEDIDSYDASLRKLTYYKNDRTKSITLEKTVAVIKNGLGLKGFNNKTFEISSGELLLYDNDSNGKYDVVIIRSAEYFVVDVVSNTTKTIYNKITYDSLFKSLVLDKTEKRRKISIYKEGRKADFSEIKPEDILEVYCNPDAQNQVIKVMIAGSKVSGTVDKISEKASGTEVVISGKNYRVSRSYQKAYDSNDKMAPLLSVNGDYEFYLNGKDEIIAADQDNLRDATVAYFYGVDKKEGLKEEYKVLVFTEDGEWKTYFLANRVTIGGQRKKPKDVLGQIESLDGSLIKYRLNEEEKVAEIVQAVDFSVADDDDFTTLAFDDRYYRGGKISSLDNTYYFDPSAVVFSVPEDGDREKFQILGKSYFVEYTSYNLALYDINEYNIAKYFVITATDSLTTSRLSNGAVMIVEESYETVSSDGEIMTRISGPSGLLTKYSISIDPDAIEKKSINGSVSYTLERTQVKQGDVIRFITNEKGNISCYEILARKDQQTDYLPTSLFAKASYIKGSVLKSDQDIYAVKLDVGGTIKPVVGNETTKVYIVQGGIVSGSMADVEPGDFALVIYPNGFANTIVLYKN